MKPTFKRTQQIFFYIRFAQILIFLQSQQVESCAITYKTSAGRLGDNITQYIKTKWFSYKYKLDFFFQPFDGANQLRASKLEPKLTPAIMEHYPNEIFVKHESDIINNLKSHKQGILFIIEPFADGFYFETEDFINYILLTGNQAFIARVQPLLLPLQLPALPIMDTSSIKVAVHIRRPSDGDVPLFSMQQYDSAPYVIIDEQKYVGGEDKNKSCVISSQENPRNVPTSSHYKLYSDIANGSLKFPPLQYYIDAIKQLALFFSKNHLHIFIFTDDSNPQSLVDKLKKSLTNLNNVTVDSRNTNWYMHIIDDCYLMSQFDCLIKSTSNFSSISQFLGEHAITIIPGDYYWDNDKLIISKRIWVIRNQKIMAL